MEKRMMMLVESKKMVLVKEVIWDGDLWKGIIVYKGKMVV